MKTKVIYIGDSNIDFPLVINDKDWLIPNGWYLLKDQISRQDVIYTENKFPLIIMEHIDINHYMNDNAYKFSVIKPDKELKMGDIVEYK